MWAALERAARRADPGLRMELLKGVVGPDTPHRSRVIAFLAGYLGDDSEPNRAAAWKMFEGPHAGFMFESLSVRDLAAIELARLLGLPDEPDEDWTAAQWAALREKVRRALPK